MLVLSGPRGSCSKARALALPRVSAHCALAQHHREHYPYSPSAQSGKCTPRCQQQPSAALFGKQELTPVMPFQCYPVNHPPPPRLPPEPTPRGSQPHSATCCLVATGFLHPEVPQAPLPTGYPADYANYIAVHAVHTVS